MALHQIRQTSQPFAQPSCESQVTVPHSFCPEFRISSFTPFFLAILHSPVSTEKIRLERVALNSIRPKFLIDARFQVFGTVQSE